MKAYAILDGGGVKGAALAGCLQAAQDRGIEFVGYGGTSAGSIVALLACVGYTGRELRRIMVEDPAFEFTKLLDDHGKDLERLRSMAKKFESSSNLKKVWTILNNLKLLNKINSNLGLYCGDNLENFLLEKVKDKLGLPKRINDITFQDLIGHKCYPLKIVASDLRFRKAVIYSAGEGNEYNGSVLSAVRASIGYPFVFAPVKSHKSHIVDGGLSSSLPVFLFEEERRRSRLPVFAFDLLVPSRPEVSIYGIKQYLGDMLSTVLDSSDKLLQELLKDIHHVIVELPDYIGTLDFSISSRQRGELFNAGELATNRYFNSYIPQYEQAETIIEKLQALHAPNDLVIPILATLANILETGTSAIDIRANIMLPTERGTLIIVYYHGMDSDPDRDLELSLDSGCAGRCWSTRTPIFADLEHQSSDWGMTPEQQRRIRNDRKTILSIPIFDIEKTRLKLNRNNLSSDIIGILSVDTSTALHDTMWNGEKINMVLEVLKQWSDILSRVLV